MTRVIIFLLIVAAAALGGTWLSERPDVVILWNNREIKVSLLFAVGAFAATVFAVIFLWAAVRLFFRWPRIVAQLRRERLKRRGQQAISRGLVAVASGDMRAARKYAHEADRFANDELLTLLLRAQNAQLAGDRSLAHETFRAMTDNPDTRLLGLRGLYIEAQRRGDAAASLQHAEDAARQAPALTWAGQAVLQARCATSDWNGALQALDACQKGGQIDKQSARRQRAVLITARAIDAQERDPAAAKQSALEAIRLVPDLVPAVALASRLEAQGGNPRKATKLIEAAWRTNPHPDLAEVYTHIRPGDAARERLKRMQNLIRINPAGREGALALARTAIDAQDFSAARAALDPLAGQPTQRYAMLMADLEEAEHDDGGRAREWMGRAMRAPRDPCWTADGVVSDRWLPVSPVTGKIDAFEWKTPVEELSSPDAFEPERFPLAKAPAEKAALAPPPEPPGENPVEAPPAAPAAAAPVPTAPVAVSPPAAPVVAPRETPASSVVAAAPAVPTAAPAPSVGRPIGRDAVIPIIHAPDDPGPEPREPKEENRRFPSGIG